jgi:two-component system, NtrC family, response regulator AtoC
MSEASDRILLVDDELTYARALGREFTLRGWSVRIAGSGTEALATLRSEPADAVIADLQMPSMDGVSLLECLRSGPSWAVLLLMSAQLDIPTTVRAMRAGADDVLQKPVDVALVDARLRGRVSAQKRSSQPSLGAHDVAMAKILGNTQAIRAVREQIRTVARYRDLPVLITGETGTGKELVAQAVHMVGESDGPFVPVNCAAIPEHLFESELFGHDAGSFTGARGAHAGLFEVAGSGTLFLDEIGELPSTLQPKLLRALESRSFRRVGSSRDVPFRARIISATHRSLTGDEARLRRDLYYRLAGFTIATPSLRDRSADLDALAQHFLSEFAARYGQRIMFSPRALEALHAYDWPGNVRELRAVVQQAAVLAQHGRVGVAELMAALRGRQSTSAHPVLADGPRAVRAPSEREPLRVRERRTIEETWESSGNNLSAAARTLGLPRTTLRDRLRKYGLR